MKDKNKKDNSDKYIWQQGEAEIYDSEEEYEKKEEADKQRELRDKYRKEAK